MKTYKDIFLSQRGAYEKTRNDVRQNDVTHRRQRHGDSLTVGGYWGWGEGETIKQNTDSPEVHHCTSHMVFFNISPIFFLNLTDILKILYSMLFRYKVSTCVNKKVCYLFVLTTYRIISRFLKPTVNDNYHQVPFLSSRCPEAQIAATVLSSPYFYFSYSHFVVEKKPHIYFSFLIFNRYTQFPPQKLIFIGTDFLPGISY